MPDKLDQFFRCEKTAHGWDFQVTTLHWPHPHTPELAWTVSRCWKTAPDSARLKTARNAALGNTRYFRTCSRCNELNNAGHMHNRHTCQSCAERHLGVVH